MEIIKQIKGFIEEPLKAIGYEVVQILISGKNRWQVRITIDRLDRQSVTIEDCVHASRLISTTLDVEDPIKNPYTLEVSSPGLDRPLIKKEDYQRFVGQKIKLQLAQPMEGRKNFTGLLTEANEEAILLILEEEEEKEVKIVYGDIHHAHLIPEF